MALASALGLCSLQILSRGEDELAKHNEIAPFERRPAQRWTRLADYWPDGRVKVVDLQPAAPATLAEFRARPRPDQTRKNRRGLLLPVAFVAGAAILSLWASGGMNRSGGPQPQMATSRGLIFGLCESGGLTNCVVSGDSFYLGGKTVRIASIEAPQIYGAACPKEIELGQRSAARLRELLNSGEIELTRTSQDLDRFGLLLRNVSIDGKDAGQAMIGAGLARSIGDMTRSWC
ncbi:MAG: thermonuclease family protein [Sphingomonas sp.]|nr:thermonuclease family protein [Sphingomonas sp.]